MAKTINAVRISNALEELAARFADAMAEGATLQVQLGDMAREAATLLKDDRDNLVPFTDACRQMCVAHELTEGTVDKTLSQLRGVIRALCDGAELPADATLRAMYDAIPKDASRGGRKPRQPASGTAASGTSTAPTVAQAAANDPTKIDAETAIRRLFGHFDGKLADAIEYAVQHEQMFTAWAAASASAAQAQPVKVRRVA